MTEFTTKGMWILVVGCAITLCTIILVAEFLIPRIFPSIKAMILLGLASAMFYMVWKVATRDNIQVKDVDGE